MHARTTEAYGFVQFEISNGTIYYFSGIPPTSLV